MPDEQHRTPGQATPPRHETSQGIEFRNTEEGGAQPEASGAEPSQEDLGRRSFAGENFAGDQRRQMHERGAGLGAGGSDNYAARHPDDANPRRQERQHTERDGNGEPLGGDRPTDEMD